MQEQPKKKPEWQPPSGVTNAGQRVLDNYVAELKARRGL